MIKLINKKIMAIVPEYTDIGDITKVYTFESPTKHEIAASSRTFVRKLLYLYAIDRKAMNKSFRNIGIGRNAPILLGDKILAQIKVRKPIMKGDSAYAFVDPEYIVYATQTEKGVEILFKNGEKLICISSYAIFSKSIMRAKAILKKHSEFLINSYMGLF